MQERTLKEKGEFGYDYLEDILFFKVKDREYSRSIELENIVVDLDEENFIVGIQIFQASEFLQVPKDALRNVPKWQFLAHIYESKIEIRLIFEMIVRNKTIEKNPIIIESIKEKLPESEMMCTVP